MISDVLPVFLRVEDLLSVSSQPMLFVVKLILFLILKSLQLIFPFPALQVLFPFPTLSLKTPCPAAYVAVRSVFLRQFPPLRTPLWVTLVPASS